MLRRLFLVLCPLIIFVLPLSLFQGQEAERLPAPEDLWFQGNTLYWSEVEGANWYFARRVHGQRADIFPPPDSRRQMTYDDMQDGEDYEFTVRAADTSDRTRDSAWSRQINVRYNDRRCLELTSGKYIAMPDSDFLSGSPLEYEDDLCRGQGAPSGIVNEHGLVHTENNISVASFICGRGNRFDRAYVAAANDLFADGHGYTCAPAQDWQCALFQPEPIHADSAKSLLPGLHLHHVV